MCTCFLLKPESEAEMAKSQKASQIVHPLEECFTGTPEIPESMIGYKEGLLLGWMQKRGVKWKNIMVIGVGGRSLPAIKIY